MINMIQIETDYTFPKIDQEIESYFITLSQDSVISKYSFRTLPEFRQLLQSRLSTEFSNSEVQEIVKSAFRNKPKDTGTVTDVNSSGREVVDFIYEL